MPFEVTVLSAVGIAAATSGSKRRRCKVHSGLGRQGRPSARHAVSCTFAPQGTLSPHGDLWQKNHHHADIAGANQRKGSPDFQML